MAKLSVRRDAGGALGVEQAEERRLLGVVGLGRVAGGGADAAVGLGDQLLGREGLVGRVAPELAADALVQPLGEGLGEAVGERLDQDRGIVVVRPLEALGDRDLLDAGGDDEAADIVGRALGRDEVGERDVRLAERAWRAAGAG